MTKKPKTKVGKPSADETASPAPAEADAPYTEANDVSIGTAIEGNCQIIINGECIDGDDFAVEEEEEE